MGINGLTSFLNRSYLEQVLVDLKLQNTFLLIDGYSLLYKLHYLNNIPSFYGGNYDDLAAKLNELFQIFKQCNIEPIFLLDGGRDLSDRKFTTNLKRANQRLNDGCSLNAGLNDSKKTAKNLHKINLDQLIQNGNYEVLNRLLPIMSPKIFCDILTNNKILFFQCNFEADYQLAMLANELKCPLLSCDSDFFIYDLTHGYISIDYIDMNIRRLKDFINDSKQSYIPVKLYSLNNLLAEFKQSLQIDLPKKMLAIFAVLLGNDYVDKSIFNSLLQTFDATNNNLKFRRLKRDIVGYARRKTNYHKKLLEWLAAFQSTDQCLEAIFKFVKQDKHDLIKQVINESIEEYCLQKTSMKHYFLTEIQSHYSNNILLVNQMMQSTKLTDKSIDLFNKELKTFNDKQLDLGFIDLFRQGKLSRFCLDILIHRRVIFSTQIEVSDWNSTYLSSIPIRTLFYSILINRFELPDSKPIVINEYLRLDKQIKIYDLLIDETVNSGSLTDKFIIEDLFKLNESITNFEMNQLLKYFFIVINHWIGLIKDLTPIKCDNYKRAFIVSLIKLAIIDQCLPKETNSTNLKVIDLTLKDNLLNEFKTDMSTLNAKLTDNDYIKDLKAKLYSFTCTASNKIFNLKLIHCLCEFQAVYLSLNYIEEFMNAIEPGLNTFKLVKLNHFFNASFLHNFVENLERRPHPDLYIEELFGRKSLFKYLYYDLLGQFNDLFQIKDL